MVRKTPWRRKPGKAAVLGCGPAGMFAAHGLVQMGWDVTIYSNKRRSHMFGAQYLHRPIDGLPCGEPVDLRYRLIGTAEEYAVKVYGPELAAGLKVSPETLAPDQRAWNIRSAYYAAYERYEQSIVDCLIDCKFMDSEFANPRFKGYWGFVANTIPLNELCRQPRHNFASRKIWAAGDAPELDRWCPVTCELNTVVCNGERDRAWYRASNVHGYNTAEWPHNRRPPIEGVAEVEKPISTDCDCMESIGITNLGRYGQWKKGVLSHHAYLGAQNYGRP